MDSDAATETRLRELIARGYRFIHPTDADGTLVAVVGVRVHDGVIDVIQLNAEDDAIAMRMPGTEPDIFAPNEVLWRSTGPAQHVMETLLALPGASTPWGSGGKGPTISGIRGCWVPTRAGAAAWLPAAV